MVWEVALVAEVDEWFLGLAKSDPDTAALVQASINLLEVQGPMLGRPSVDRIKGSKIHNMKELRPGSAGTSEVRILFVFDPDRQAILLVAGDKSGQWSAWYKSAIPLAEKRYEDYLGEREGERRGT